MKKEIAYLIDLPKIYDPRGSLTVAEENIHAPFELGTVEWEYEMAAGEDCPAERYAQGKMMIVALSGSFDITTSQGSNSTQQQAIRFHLNHPYKALIIGKGIWHQICNCSNGTVALIIREGSNTLPRR